MDPPQTKSWSIHTRQEITSKYSILERIGSGAYSDVYKAIRKSDNLTVALKEIHDYQSSFREIEALNSLQNSPNVVVLLEYFWSEDEDAVLVLEYLPTDLSDVIKEGDLSVGQIKRWMVQILSGVDTCHRNNIVHRDLKPSNLLISPHGVLKLADFGQARILLDTPNNGTEEDRVTQNSKEEENEDTLNLDLEEDPLKNTQSEGSLTSCVGTRWFRAPELLYGSTNYKFEIDLWSLGCIFAELLSLKPLFPGTSDIDQISRIFNVLGNMSEEIWAGCVKLPDYNLISFGEVENPIGLEACLPNRGSDEINLVKKLLCFDPEKRATAIELLNDKYLNEEPLPVPISELRVPLKQSDIDNEESPGQYEDFNSDSDMDDEFGPMSFTKTDKGFSIRFS